jgi:molybdopterin-guanine dinucleotide biosynthesis protein A
VLAGGRSTRFGTADKLGAMHAGMPLLQHAVTRVAEITGDVVVVLAPDAPEPSFPPGMPVRLVHDPREGEGPLAGAVAGLAHVERALAVIVGGDMPALSTAVLLEMLHVAAGASVDAVVLQDGDRFRPLPAAIRAAAGRDSGQALLQQGVRSLRAWLQAMRMAVIDEATWTALDPERATLHDVDEPADLDTT